MASILGLTNLPSFPYVEEQAFGAYMGLCIIAIWTTRKHLTKVLKRVIGRGSKSDDANEPMPYRWAVLRNPDVCIQRCVLRLPAGNRPHPLSENYGGKQHDNLFYRSNPGG